MFWYDRTNDIDNPFLLSKYNIKFK